MSTAPDLTGPLREAAHAYRNRGWRVIQLHSVGPDGKTCSCRRGGHCKSAGKHPRDDQWQNTGAYSAADVEALWDERPKANVGIATGAPSGFWVLDLDPKDDGIAEFGNLLAQHGGEFPATYCVQTGSGGFHYYFAMPDFDVRNSSAKLAKGVDVRGTGGQVVAAPSRTDKGDYVVLRDVEPTPAPDWLLALVKTEERPVDIVTAESLPKPEDIAPEEWERLNVYTQKALEAELKRLDALHPQVWNGRDPWNHTTFEVSCAVIEFANSPWNSYSLGQAQSDVLTRAPRDPDGFDDFIVQKTFNSARDKVGDKARPVPAARPATPEVDPLFGGVDVRRRTPDPTEGADPVGVSAGPARFFDEKGELNAVSLRNGIVALGPVGFGRDRDFWRYEHGVWIPDTDLVEGRTVALLGRKYRPGHAKTAHDMVKYVAQPISGDPLGQYMNFANTMLDWQTGEQVPHSPEFGSTIQFPVNYNPEATCPTFDRFLADVMHDDYVALAWEMLGYLMYSGNPLQVAFLFYGSGQNGKGTLLRVIEEILGRGNVANESLDQLNQSTFSAVNLYGKIANIAGDIDSTYQESTANFKKLTGEDMIGAEKKYGARFNFQNWAVPLFSANKIPGSSDVTEGYLRRWIVLHFHKRITNPTRGLSDLLSLEIEGIAAKAIPALQTLMQRGSFALDGEAAKGREEFAEAIDQVRQWVRHSGVQQAPETWQPLQLLYSEYSIWADRTGGKRLREQEFSHRLEAIGYERADHAGLPHHKGLRTPTLDQRAATPATFF